MSAWLSYLAIVLIWGSSYFAVYLGLESFTPLGLLGLRFLIATLAAFIIAFIRREPFAPRSQWFHLTVVGLTMIGLANMLTTWAIQTLPTGLVAVLMALTPLWIVVFSLRREKPSLMGWLGLLFGVLGVFLLVGPGSIYKLDVAALVAVMLAPMLWAYGTVHAKHYLRLEGTFHELAIQMGVSTVLIFSIAIFSGGITQGPITLQAMRALVFLALFASLIAYAAYFYIVKLWSAKKVGTFAYLTPLVAVCLGTMRLGEALSFSQVAGIAVVLLSVALVRAR